VIVRISSEGQYEISPEDTDGFTALDNEAVTACAAAGEAGFHEVFGRLLDYVREKGRPVPDDELYGSDMILPPPDVSLEEARSEFQGEGLIPG
jgi:hypothetical protein